MCADCLAFKTFVSISLVISTILSANVAFGVEVTELHTKMGPASILDSVAQNPKSIPEAQVNKTIRMTNMKATSIENQEWALAFTNNGPYTGASGEITTWHPHVEANERSFSFVGCGKSNGISKPTPTQLEVIMFAGWQVASGDEETRIFVAYSRNQEFHLCINDQQCEGFVRVGNGTIRPGSNLLPQSVYGDPSKQFATTVAILRDDQGKWWASFGGIKIGYFDPNAIFNLDCDTVMWGGFVQTTSKLPTPTQMGNGHFPNEGFSKSGQIVRALVYKGGEITAEPPTAAFLSRPQCYDIKNLGMGPPVAPGGRFLYGGPGSGSNTCY